MADWGYHLATGFGSGEFRAGWGEVAPAEAKPALSNGKVRAAGFSGEICSKCQGQRLVRAGTCNTCLDCGETTGCS